MAGSRCVGARSARAASRRLRHRHLWQTASAIAIIGESLRCAVVVAFCLLRLPLARRWRTAGTRRLRPSDSRRLNSDCPSNLAR
eukprot:COSAG06_NODE_1341_length_9798_cov_3.432931_7_plen_84_part_00